MAGNRNSGRRPTPTETKIARGKPGHRPLPVDEPEPPRTTTPPAFIKGEALKHWKLIAKQLDDVKVLTLMDAMSLAAYCEQFNRYIKARDAIDRGGLTMVTHTGHLVVRPEIGIMDGCHDRMLKILMEFGCTPASRTKVRMAKEAEKKGNKFGELADADDE